MNYDDYKLEAEPVQEDVQECIFCGQPCTDEYDEDLIYCSAKCYTMDRE